MFRPTFSQTTLECLEEFLIVSTCLCKTFRRNIGKLYKRLLITLRSDQGNNPISDQCSTHTESSQLIYNPNQLTGFCISLILFVSELRSEVY